ncbi:MAG: VOC family protein [Agrococcus casei]|uniref:VOC family protein n=1 Tax=Agrococcus casei TaxID=343512 RepID=UPI003F8DC756
MAKVLQITFDCADPLGLGEFWCEVLGYVRESPPEAETWEEQLRLWKVPESEWNSRNAIIDPEGASPRIYFQRVPEGKSAKNRLHLDIRQVPGLTGEERMAAFEQRAAELVAMGAERVQRLDDNPATGDLGIIVMRDPEGNEFCLD